MSRVSAFAIGRCVTLRLLPITAGQAFSGLQNQKMYPVVGLRSVGEIVKANFGQTSFQFDIHSYIQVCEKDDVYWFSFPVLNRCSCGIFAYRRR
jgi:hypothetical protein